MDFIPRNKIAAFVSDGKIWKLAVWEYSVNTNMSTGKG